MHFRYLSIRSFIWTVKCSFKQHEQKIDKDIGKLVTLSHYVICVSQMTMYKKAIAESHAGALYISGNSDKKLS